MPGPTGTLRLGGIPQPKAQPANPVRRSCQRTRRERQLQGSARGVHLQRGDIGLQRGLPVGRGWAQATGTGRTEKVAEVEQPVQPELDEDLRV